MLINRAYFEDDNVYRALMAHRDVEIEHADKIHAATVGRGFRLLQLGEYPKVGDWFRWTLDGQWERLTHVDSNPLQIDAYFLGHYRRKL